jgi:hypothetical protein
MTQWVRVEGLAAFSFCVKIFCYLIYYISQSIRHIVIFLLEILEKGKNIDECTLILVTSWKKTGLLHTKISNHNVIY